MNINEQTLKGKWQEMKGEVQKAWGRLTNDELDQAKGDMNILAGLVKQKYGDTREDFENKLSTITNRYNEPIDRSDDDMGRRDGNL